MLLYDIPKKALLPPPRRGAHMEFEARPRQTDIRSNLEGELPAAILAFACISLVFLTLGIMGSYIR